MVKKKNKKEKGRGAEKAAQKLAKKSKKEEGMEDLEALIAEFKLIDKKKTEYYEEKCKQPSPRINLSVTVHPEKDEIILFGGEYDTGNKTYVYNDLFAYNIKKNEWSQLFMPNPPPRRCAHQAVTLAKDGGQMWVFGGEFASPSRNKFYHYKDLWVLNFQKKIWEQVNSPGGPSPRSGHRMANYKKQLIIFGGFHESSRDFAYFNDLYSFDLTEYQWSKILPTGHGPCPRSGCHLIPTQTGVLIIGGYSKTKVKKDVDKGNVHDDMYMLEAESGGVKEASAVLKWKWGKVKETGAKPSTRSSYGMTQIGQNRALIFGGVFDEEDDDDEISSIFYNTMHCVDLTSHRWFPFDLRKQTTKNKKKKEKEKEEKNDEADENTDEEKEDDQEASAPEKNIVWVPCGRMNPIIVSKHNILYLYGGAFEEDDKQVTLNDLWSLNLKNPTTWTQICESDDTSRDWHESDSATSENEDENDEAVRKSKEGDESSSSEVVTEHPKLENDEDFEDYWMRTSEHWLEIMSDEADEATPANRIKRAAKNMAEAFFIREMKTE